VAFIDSDDIFSVDALQLLYDGYTSLNIDVVYGFFSRNFSKVQNNIKPRDNRDIYTSFSIYNTMYVLMNEKYRLGFTTFLFKKQIIDDNQIDFPVGLKTGEDLEFLWKYLVYCVKSIEINRYIYWYYDNPVSAVHKIEWSRTNSYSSIFRIKKMMVDANCEFADVFYNYMSARYLWSYAKTFSVGDRKDLFIKLSKEYPVKDGMRVLLKKCPDMRVRLTAGIYLINKYLFYYAVGIIGR